MILLAAMAAFVAFALIAVWLRLRARDPSLPPSIKPPIDFRFRMRHALIVLLPWHAWLLYDGYRVSPSVFWEVSIGLVLAGAAISDLTVRAINLYRLRQLPRGWYWTSLTTLTGAVNNNAVMVFKYEKGHNAGLWAYRYRGRTSEYVYPRPEGAVVAALEAAV